MLKSLLKGKVKDKITFKSIYNKRTHVQDLEDFDKDTRKQLIKLTNDLVKKDDYEYRDFLDYYNNIPDYLDEENKDFYKNHIEMIFDGSIYLSDNNKKYREQKLEDICKNNHKVLVIGTGTNSKVQTLKSISNFGVNEFLVIQNYNDNFDATVKIYKNENLINPLSVNVLFKDNEVLLEKITENLAEKEITFENVKKSFSECDIDYLIDIEDIMFEQDKIELIDIIEQIKSLLVIRKKEILKEMFEEISKVIADFKFECIKGNNLLLIDSIDKFDDFNDLKCFNLIIKDYSSKEEIQYSLNRIITSNLSFKSLTPLVYEINIFEKDNQNRTFKMKYGNIVNKGYQRESISFINDILYDFDIVLTHSPKGVIEDDFEKILRLLIENGRINNTTLIIDDDIKETLKSNISRLSDLNNANKIDIDYKMKQVSENIIKIDTFRDINLQKNEANISLPKDIDFEIPVSKIIFSSLTYQTYFINGCEFLLNFLERENLIKTIKNINFIKTIIIEELSRLFFTVVNNNILNPIKNQNEKLTLEKYIYKEKNYLRDFLYNLDNELRYEIVTKLCDDILRIINKNDEDYKIQIITLIKSTISLENYEINFYNIFIRTFMKSLIFKELNINISIEK